MPSKTHLVGSCGGSKSICGLAGLYWAVAQLLGWQLAHWDTMGGSSGATIIQAIARGSGLTPTQIIDLVLSTNFAEYVECPRLSGFQRLRAVLKHMRAEATMPWPYEALVKSERLGEFVDRLVPGPWPRGLWMLGADQCGQPIVLFEKGIYRWRATDRSLEELSPTPPPVGLAVRAACSIPTLFTPPRLQVRGEELLVWDGAFTMSGSIYGLCPIEVPIHYWQAPPSTILAFDVSQEPFHRGFQGMVRRLLRYYWWGIADPPWPATAQEVARIVPDMQFSALDLDLSLGQKWQTIAQAVSLTARACCQHGLLEHEQRILADRLVEALNPYIKTQLDGWRRGDFVGDLRKTFGIHGFALSA